MGCASIQTKDRRRFSHTVHVVLLVKFVVFSAGSVLNKLLSQGDLDGPVGQSGFESFK